MRAFTVPPPRVAFMGFEAVDLREAFAQQPPPRGRDAVSSYEHMRAVEQSYVSGATHMARLHIERARQAARRLYAERTKWGAGLLVALALGWLLRGMQP